MTLDAERWKRVREIFVDAVDLPPEACAAYLADSCGEDDELRREVESLLDHAEPTDSIERAVGAAMASRAAEEPTRIGTDVGPYRVLERIGAGGMGAVWLAERTDGAFHKRVALKIVRGGLDSPQLIARFRAERQILARLEHPGIARILDGGETPDGLPFVVLEHVDGKPIDRHCREANLPVREVVRLVRRVCDAVEYAHRHLVIHRDLKPANILVTADGDPKLLDFGIAKLLADDGVAAVTVAGGRPMTPEYAAPEQIRGEPVSTATDVHALGLILYELLTGRHPFRDPSASRRELESAVLETDPVPPSSVVGRGGGGTRRPSRELPGELDDVVLMALEKDAGRRYASVAELSDDLGRFLRGLPVRARPATVGYRAAKFVRRHVVGVGVAAAFALTLVAATVISTSAYLRANRARQEAENQRATAEEINGFLQGMFAAASPVETQSKTELTAREVLGVAAARVGDELADRPRVAAALLRTVGESYRDLGLWEEAESALRRAVDAWRNAGSLDDEAALLTRVDLGDVLSERGSWDEAEDLLRGVIDAAPPIGRRPGPGATARRALAEALERQGKYDESESTSVALIEELRAAEEDPESTLWFAINDLAMTYQSKGDYVRAEQAMREALAGFRAALGERHSQVGRVLANLAFVLNRLERREEAAEVARESLSIKRDVYGEDHVQLAHTRVQLAEALGSLGRFEEAEAEFERTLETYRAVYGERSHYVAVTTLNLAMMIWKDAGGVEDALPRMKEGAELLDASVGPEHPWTLAARHNVASIYEALGRLREAESLCRENLALRRRVLDADNTDVARSEILLGRLLLARDDRTEAEAPLRDAVRICALNLPADHPLRTGAEEQLARCLEVPTE